MADTLPASGGHAHPGSLPSCASDWSPADVALWVSDVLKLPQYASALEEKQVDGPTLLELSEDLLDSELGIKNPIHRKKILGHVKLLNGELIQRLPQPQLRSTPRGRRTATPRSGPSSTPPTWVGPGSTARGALACDDQGDDISEDIMSSAGAASLKRGASSTGGLPGSSAASSLLPRKEHSVLSSNYSCHGNALADRAAARRTRSMERLVLLQQRNQALSRRLAGPPGSPPQSSRQSGCPPSPTGSFRSAGALSRVSNTSSRRRAGSNKPPDGKAIAASGKRIDAWGELGPSTSRKGSFGKMPAGGEVSRTVGPHDSPIAARRDTADPCTSSSYFYKATFQRSNKSAMIPRARRPMDDLTPKSASPGPAYRPQAEWTKLRVGGTIGAATRFNYHSPTRCHWLCEVSED